MAFYELMFIVKPELDEEQVSTATDKVHQLIVANGGNVTKTASWGKRRLAYQVGPYREGYYVVSNFDVETSSVVELERVLKISDTVFRHLLVKRDRASVGQQEVYVPDFTDEDIAAMSRVSDEDYEEAPAAVVPEELDVEVNAADSAQRPAEADVQEQGAPQQDTPAEVGAAPRTAAMTEEGGK
ncbi:MAG TPA: 30S ribosomal protein S6 [Candidatus Dormibacteraeota bacterium]|nr:30S ribosomal protein S6 [Candidatus Dormibacteraeota bacterium]